MSCCWKLFRVDKKRSGSRKAILIGRTRYYILYIWIVCAIRGTTWRRHASIQNKFTISITCLSGITLSVRRLGLPWCWWRNEMLPVAVATGYITLPALFSLLAGFHHVSINFMLCSAIRPVLYLAASQQHTGYGILVLGWFHLLKIHHQIFFLLRYYIQYLL